MRRIHWQRPEISSGKRYKTQNVILNGNQEILTKTLEDPKNSGNFEFMQIKTAKF